MLLFSLAGFAADSFDRLSSDVNVKLFIHEVKMLIVVFVWPKGEGTFTPGALLDGLFFNILSFYDKVPRTQLLFSALHHFPLRGFSLSLTLMPFFL